MAESIYSLSETFTGVLGNRHPLPTATERDGERITLLPVRLPSWYLVKSNMRSAPLHFDQWTGWLPRRKEGSSPR